jgi:hypothetical protein
MKKFVQVLLLTASLLFACGLLCEIGALGLIRFRGLCRDTESALACFEWRFSVVRLGNRLLDSSSFLHHYYFGFINSWHRPIFQQLEQDRHDPSAGKDRKSEFRVAVLGGSLSAGFTLMAGPYFAERLQREIPSLRSRQVKVYPMAFFLGKQPQQFLLSAFYGDQFDLVVNIDGHNEVHGNPIDPTLPLQFEFTAKPVTLGDLPFMTSAFIVRNLVKFGLRSRNLRRSYFYLLLTTTVYERWLHYYAHSRPISDDFRFESRLSSYHRFTQMQYFLLKKQGVPSIYFIQPNQNYLGTKVASDEEAKYFEPSSAPMAQLYNAWYRRINADLVKLRKIGVPAFSLSDVFSGDKRTIYSDACCHLTLLGSRVLAEKLAVRIAREFHSLGK